MATVEKGFVQVDLDRLDRLLNLVGELVISRISFGGHARKARTRHGFKEQVLELLENLERLTTVSTQIQSRIVKARLVPVGTVFRRFVSLVERLSENTGKSIELRFRGDKTEVDKRTIDALSEPLVHLVRNALDHGIEPANVRKKAGKPARGSVHLQASHQGNRLIIDVLDDGAGIDSDKARASAVKKGLLTREQAAGLNDHAALDLLFHPEVSTAGAITELSGRGVGLDAARQCVRALGGQLRIASTIGQGTRATIELPLTTAIVQALVVGIGDEIYGLPLEHVQEIVRLDSQRIARSVGNELYDLRGKALSVVRLADLVEAPARLGALPMGQIVVLRAAERDIGLLVDGIVGRREIVVKAMGRTLSGIRGIAGGSIAEDGHVFMVLDPLVICCDQGRTETPGQGEAQPTNAAVLSESLSP